MSHKIHCLKPRSGVYSLLPVVVWTPIASFSWIVMPWMCDVLFTQCKKNSHSCIIGMNRIHVYEGQTKGYFPTTLWSHWSILLMRYEEIWSYSTMAKTGRGSDILALVCDHAKNRDWYHLITHNDLTASKNMYVSNSHLSLTTQKPNHRILTNLVQGDLQNMYTVNTPQIIPQIINGNHIILNL